MAAPAGVDTSSQEWQLACLARHICRLPTKSRRLDFMDLMRARHPAEFTAHVEQLVRREWAILYPRPDFGKVADGNA